MSTKSSYKVINKSIAVYEDLMNNVSEELFIRTPAEGVWSYAEVFTHIFSSTLGCIKAIEVCSVGKGQEDNTPTPFKIRVVLFFKRFPPGKFKVPERLAKDVLKINRTEATAMINNCKAQLEAAYPLIAQSSPTQKIKHPRLGLINASQWYSFIQIHLLHHQRQLDRIKAIHKNA